MLDDRWSDEEWKAHCREQWRRMLMLQGRVEDEDTLRTQAQAFRLAPGIENPTADE